MAKHNGNANPSKHIKPSPLASALHVEISLRVVQGLPARVNRKNNASTRHTIVTPHGAFAFVSVVRTTEPCSGVEVALM